MKRSSIGLYTLAVFALLAGCASGPDIRVNSDPGANFGSYKTFNFYEPFGTDRGGYQSLVSQQLKAIATREMTARGYTLSDTPDLLVNFGGKLDDKVRVTSTPSMAPPMGYYGYRAGFYSPWYGYGGSDVNVDQYTQGTINLDIIDAASKRLVWEAVAEGRVDSKALDDIPAALERVVPSMFAKLPTAGGGPPLAPPAK